MTESNERLSDRLNSDIIVFSKALDIYVDKLEMIESRNDKLGNTEKQLRNFRFYILLLSSQLDICICLKYLESPATRYEGMFLRNISFMKMQEATKKIIQAYSNEKSSAYLYPELDTKEKILSLANAWNEKYMSQLNDIRINATAHYDSDFIKYYKIGYTENDPALT